MKKFNMQIGVHCKKGSFNTLHNAIANKFNIGADEKEEKKLINVIQIHTHGPRNTREREINIGKIREVIEKNHAKLYIHTSCLTYPWKDTSFMLNHSNSQIRMANQLHANGIVFHLPKLNPIQIIPALKKLITMNHISGNYTTIILEMTSQKPSSFSYALPEQINALTDEIKKNKISDKHVGICIDTSHIFVHPDVKIQEYTDAKQYLSKLINHNYIKLFHINGNSVSGFRDCHTIPFAKNDLIWGDVSYQESGLRAFVMYAHKYQISMVLEINTINFRNEIKDLINYFRL